MAENVDNKKNFLIKGLVSKIKRELAQQINSENISLKSSDGMYVSDKRFKKYLKEIQKIEKQIDQLNDKYGVNDINVPRTNQSDNHNVTGVRSDDSARRDVSEFHIRGIGNSNNNGEVRNTEVQRSSNREYHIRGLGNSSNNSEVSNSETQSEVREYHIKGIKDSRSKVVKLVNSVKKMEEEGVEFHLSDSISLDQSYVLNDDAVTQISSQDLVVTDYTLTSYCYQKNIKKEDENIMRRKLSKGNVSLALLISIIFFVFSIVLFLVR